jgi:pSer/pThr/pTyr-binding forkhead associated (FHA) protein
VYTDDERVNVTDLRSTNGTYIDGTEITSMQAYEVLPGSNIIFGDEHLAMYELRIVEEPAKASEVSSSTAVEDTEATKTASTEAA